jgi:uncharacterized protein YecE (DUF72 family)
VKNKTPHHKLYTGTSGIVVPIPQSAYPPAFKGKSRLTYYSSLLNSLEVNSSFYKNPQVATILKWCAAVEDNFSFTFKVPKTISHAKDLKFDKHEVNSFIGLIDHVEEKKGCILIQLPPSLQASAFVQLKSLIKEFRSATDTWDIAVEFRHPSWYISKVMEALAKMNTAIVMHDHPKAPTPLDIETSFKYFRFHGEGGRYRGSYTESQLKEYASIARNPLAAGEKVYCYFNNTMGDAFANAKTFQQLCV